MASKNNVVTFARRFMPAPSREKAEGFLEYLAEAITRDDITCYDTLIRQLPVMSRTHGFLTDVMHILSTGLRSSNTDVVLATLDVIAAIVGRHGKKLSVFTTYRIVSDVVLLEKSEDLTYTLAMSVFSRMIDTNPNDALYSLERLMGVSAEEVRLEIIALLFAYIMGAKNINIAVASAGCSLALEGLLHPSSATRLATFDLIYALQYRGVPRGALITFFMDRKAPRGVLKAVRMRLRRRYTPPLMPTEVSDHSVRSDADLVWAGNIVTSSDCAL